MHSKVFTLNIRTNSKEEFINIDNLVVDLIAKNNIKSGIALIFCPHTTAGITINENADPDVVRDLLIGFNRAFPEEGDYKHFEGNSHAHLKASTVGMSDSIIVQNGKPLLGTWQSIYFCEFDGPRNRNVIIKFIED